MTVASVIVPARDASATLPRTLAALAAQDVEGEYEVVVVDDGSRDETAALAAEACGTVRVLRRPPHGPAAARNHGVAAARGDILAFCDADVYPTPGWLAAGIRALREADLVQGRVLPDPTRSLGPFDRTIWVEEEAGLYETANLFVRRDCFERVGGFEAWLAPRGGKALAEDVWFGYRARRLGARTAFSAEALAHHAVLPRDWRGYVRERGRVEYFPAMTRQMPELRARFLYRRVFLNPRTARLDLALLGLAAAALSGSAVPVMATAPYVRAVSAHARRAGVPGAWGVALVDLTADLVGAVSLLGGSWRYRAPVI